jgi:hypothetical protein
MERSRVKTPNVREKLSNRFEANFGFIPKLYHTPTPGVWLGTKTGWSLRLSNEKDIYRRWIYLGHNVKDALETIDNLHPDRARRVEKSQNSLKNSPKTP